MTTLTQTRLSLQGDCSDASCLAFSWPLFTQLREGYEECSVLPIPSSLEEWRSEHRTARKRADRASRLGYGFCRIRREFYEDDIYAINTSLESRQGRQMTRPYRERMTFSPLPDYPCSRHAVMTYGVENEEGTLVAYLWLYRSGDLALVSSILGHGAHLGRDVMYLLVEGVIRSHAGEEGSFVYNRHDSGTEGLRYFKSKLGFVSTDVLWEM